MSRFTSLQLTLLCVFCFYWFVFFPIIWFVVRPPYFADDIVQALLFAIFLLVIYCVLHLLIICALERCCKPPTTRATIISNGVQHLPPPPEAVMYHNKTSPADNGDTKETEMRFVSSFELFFDGNKFKDSTNV